MQKKALNFFLHLIYYGTDWDTMCDVQIPIPDIEIQRAIAEVYTVYNKRKKINEQLKAQIKDICPILIRGSLEDGGETNGETA